MDLKGIAGYLNAKHSGLYNCWCYHEEIPKKMPFKTNILGVFFFQNAVLHKKENIID
jgi:hypothetical protein